MTHRYFIEVSYNGLAYSGFQTQPEAPTIQQAVETALYTILRQSVALTGSSRTDAEVHARQNYFHFDTELEIPGKISYNINAVLPPDIVVKSIREVQPAAHARFDATSRLYTYHIYNRHNPFLHRRAYFYPYQLSHESLQAAAAIVAAQTGFENYSKRNTQVKTYNCNIQESQWVFVEEELIYRVRANRFLRGMVRGLAGTMLKVGTGRISLEAFEKSFSELVAGLVDFSAPGYGLYLEEVTYPEKIFI
jgi:tRNA pseudouridine38-40 synthase